MSDHPGGVMNAQLVHDAGTVGVHGLDADMKGFCDLFVGEPRCDPFEDL